MCTCISTCCGMHNHSGNRGPGLTKERRLHAAAYPPPRRICRAMAATSAVEAAYLKSLNLTCAPASKPSKLW